jgi:hypothetical protein
MLVFLLGKKVLGNLKKKKTSQFSWAIEASWTILFTSSIAYATNATKAFAKKSGICFLRLDKGADGPDFSEAELIQLWCPRHVCLGRDVVIFITESLLS